MTPTDPLYENDGALNSLIRLRVGLFVAVALIALGAVLAGFFFVNGDL